MNHQIMTIARKELRAYFLSPVALIFIGAFLFVVMFSFFTLDTFFERNIADVRPLFHWLPILLVFLVAALTMRLWSEEQRAGTLEILLTLPVPVHRLVLGKFFAGMGLVGVALALTLSLPITVSFVGDLDWGPVFGGYLGALLLAGAYLAVGLCISSSTDNPIVALLATAGVGGLLYLVGSDTVTSFADNRTAEYLRAIGMGSRFESIQRGVIDLRDLVYYGSICVGCLYLNTVLLKAKRWSQGAVTRPWRRVAKTSAVLVVVNLLLLNVTMAPVRAARWDATERDEYSISDVTEKLLGGLQAPLLIRGYFSSKTHPLLAPLVPRIRDMIEEYGVVGGRRVTAEFVDPQQNPALEKEANEVYGIKSVPFKFADRRQAGIVNSYFTILVKYGDKHETLSFDDLIEVKITGLTDAEVKLRNLEYDLTRTVKKIVFGFEPLESLFARAPGKVKLTSYTTPKTLPKNLEQLPERIAKAAKELEQRSGGKFSFERVDPTAKGNEQLPRELAKKYGFRPMPADIFSDQVFYLHLLLSVGDNHGAIYLGPSMTEAEVRSEIEAGLKRMVPGFLKTVGVVAPEPEQPPQMNPMMRQRMPRPRPEYELIKKKLGENYSVKDANLKDGRVPGDLDVLLLVAPKDLDDKQRYAVDQFLMRGGAVVICAGNFIMEAGFGGLTVKKLETKLDDLLDTWGIKVQPKLVLDEQNQAFPVPVERQVMGLTVREIQLLPYPFWVDVRGDGYAEGNPVVGGLPSVTLQWPSPLEVVKREGIETTVLLRSSDKSWLQSGTDVQPDMDKYPNKGFPSAKQGGTGDEEAKARPLAVLATGPFTSAFKDKPSPLMAAEGADKDKPADDKKRAGRTIAKAPKQARLAVIGSSDFLRDPVLALSRQTGTEVYANSLQFLENLIDWSVADVDLLSIRSRGTYARTLKPMEDGTRAWWEYFNYGVVVLGLGLVIGVTRVMRRRLEPLRVQGKGGDK